MALATIKQQRRALHLTQQELASRAGVSQSYIAKIEAGLIDPSYSLAKKILDTLESERYAQQPTAKEIMTTPLITCKETDGIKKIVQQMKKHAISQIPVREEKRIIGLVTEKGIVQEILGEQARAFTAQDVMQAAPPTIDADTPLEVIRGILKYTPIIIVMRKSTPHGSITRADLLNRYT